MSQKRNLTFRQLVDLSFGFFGVQIAYALQSANISRIFATLGADPHQLSFFWILPPLMGMLVQPLVGKYSDRTWNRMGRRRPYLIVGALIAVAVMLLLPNAGSFNFPARLFLGLNMAMWFGLFSLIFLDTSINIAMQPFKMMVGDMVNEQQKTQAYSIQSFLCNAGSLVGYLFPIFFTWIGLANTAPEGVVPPSVVWSFYIGAAILILCVVYTFARVKEMPPKEYAEFHGIDLEKKADEPSEGLFKLLVKAPKTFWTVGLVQFFCWAAFLYMWTYSNGAIASNCFGVDMTDPSAASSTGFQAAGNWVGVVFAVQAVGSLCFNYVYPQPVGTVRKLLPYWLRLGRNACPAVHPPHQCPGGQPLHGKLSWPFQLHHLPAPDCGGGNRRRSHIPGGITARNAPYGRRIPGAGSPLRTFYQNQIILTNNHTNEKDFNRNCCTYSILHHRICSGQVPG